MFESLSGAGVIAAALIAPPGWELIRALSRIDPALVNDAAQVDLIIAWERQAAYIAAMAQPALVAVAFTETHDGWDAAHEPEGSGRAEVGAALRLSPHVGELRLRRSHLDHTRRYNPDDPAGGRTDRNNLGALCEHHHLLKHRTGWTLRRHPDTEEATWTSPRGHSYRIEHEDYRNFDDYSNDLADTRRPDPNETTDVEADVQPDVQRPGHAA